MIDIVGERQRKQISQRRKDRWQYAALYSFLTLNLAFWISHLL